MASRREIRRRIRSVKNLAQITRAMQMVAASRMRRAQARVQAARPYSDAMREVVAQLAARSGVSDHPLLLERPVRRAEVVAITPDRGLAGAMIPNLHRALARYVDSSEVPVQVIAVGRRAIALPPERGWIW